MAPGTGWLRHPYTSPMRAKASCYEMVHDGASKNENWKMGNEGNSRHRWRLSLGGFQLIIWIVYLASSCQAVFVDFDNCLPQSIVHPSNPNDTTPLQFIPLFVNALFDSFSDSHNLNVTVYGNVSGLARIERLPPEDDPQWKNPNETVGKIPDLGGLPGQQKYTTFSTTLRVLGYTPWDPLETRLCNTSAITPCPFAPRFHLNVTK